MYTKIRHYFYESADRYQTTCPLNILKYSKYIIKEIFVSFAANQIVYTNSCPWQSNCIYKQLSVAVKLYIQTAVRGNQISLEKQINW